MASQLKDLNKVLLLVSLILFFISSNIANYISIDADSAWSNFALLLRFDFLLVIFALRTEVKNLIGGMWYRIIVYILINNFIDRYFGITDWSINDYLDVDHPVQVAFKDELETLSGEKVSHVAIDGCGAPLFLISLLGLARAIRNLNVSTDPVHQEVVNACRNFPEMVAGPERLSTRLMKAHPGLFMKSGAESIMVASVPDGRTFAYKVNDGGLRPRVAITVAGLKQIGIDALEEHEKVFGGDQVVGSIRSTF